MARIGVFIDTLKGSIPISFQERIASYVEGLPGISFCAAEEDLTSPEGITEMARRLTEGIDRVLILGGSPKLYESSFQKWGYPVPLNPYLVTVVNIREQALWVSKDERAAFEKAKKSIDKALRQAVASRPIETESLSLKPSVLVLGGGITGISIALALVKFGIQVYLVEKSQDLGGSALALQTVGDPPESAEKWLEEKASELRKSPHATILTQRELKSLRGHFGRFEAKIRGRSGEEDLLQVSAVVVATGCGTKRETVGIYAHRRVITLSDMERLLSRNKDSNLLYDGKEVRAVTYFLDGVNEDIKVDSIYALRQSLQLRTSFRSDVVILCKDVKVSADGLERLYRKVRETGVLFIKYEEPPRVSIVNGQIRVDVKDTASIEKKGQWLLSILSDLFVVSEAFIPSSEAERLAAILNLPLGSRGFFMEENPQYLRIRSNRRGIFVAGGCRFPQEVSESLLEASAVAEEAVSLLSKGEYAYDLAVAEVDPKKCAVCYTCPRLCPHGAITIEPYAERNIYAIPGREQKWGAAKVDPVACYGCGICVGECPARAITLRHLTDEQIYAQMNMTQ